MVERGGACVGEGVEKKEPENVSIEIIKTEGLTKAIQTDEADEGGASSSLSSLTLTLSNKQQHEKKVVSSSSSNTAATVSSSSSSSASASKLLKIDFKLINHRLKDIGLDSWTVKRFVTLVRNNFLEQQDLINEMTINKLRKLLNEHTILRFLDYLETDTLFKSRTINQLMLKSDPNTLNCCNKMVFWIDKWENNDPSKYFQHHQTVEQQTSSPIGGGAASGQVLATANNRTDQNGCGQCSSDPLMLKHSKRIVNFMTPNAMQHRPGPNMTKVMEILEKNDYILELSNGQRKYAKPSPNPGSPVQSSMMTTTTTRTESVPNNTEIFVGKIPKDMFEDELIPLFESIGPICNLRLMMDPFTGSSRGYAFITYFQPEHARSAVEKFDNHELLNYGTHLKVKMSIPNVRLFIGNISKDMTKEDIRYEFQKHATGLVDVIVYHSPHDRKRNRGFCFLEFETHKHASQAKRKFLWHHLKIWDSEIWVDWAEPLEQPNDEIMSKVKVLYVRNLLLEMNDQHIKELFAKFGSIERVKKIKDYAFVHFEQRVCALEAMKQMNGHRLVPDGLELEISLAKPPTDKKRKEEILRNREKRLMNMMMHSRFTNAIVCSNNNNNNNNPVQGITFVPQQTSSLSATAVPAQQQPPPQPLPPSSTSLVIDSLMTTTGPMFINPAGNGTLATATHVSGTSAYALPAAVPGGCIPGNYYLEYATSHQPQPQQQQHFPMYHQHHHHHHHHQLLPRSAVARVTLASNNDEILTTTNQQHLNHPSMTSMVNGSSSKSETRLYNDSDPITGFEIINDHHSKSDLDLYNRNYGHFEDCAWCSVATNAAAATIPTVQPSPQQSSNLFAIIPAMDPNPSISLSVPHHHQQHQQQQPQMQQSNVQDGQISSTTTITTTINPMIPGDVDNQTKCNNN